MPHHTLGEAIELNTQPTLIPAPSIAVSDAESHDGTVQQQPSPPPDGSPSREAPTPTSIAPQSVRSSEDLCNVPRANSPQSQSDATSGNGTTLVPSSTLSQADPSESRSQQPHGERRAASIWSLRTETGSTNGQAVLTWVLAGLGIPTLVYCIRQDTIGRYDNRVNFFEYCEKKNYSEPGCDEIRGEPLGAPPLLSGVHKIWRKVNKRRNVETQATQPVPTGITGPSKDSAAPLVFYRTIGFVIFASLLALAAYLIYNQVVRRRARQYRISDLSMARQEPAQLTKAVTTGVNMDSRGSMANRKGGRYRAFLPAEDAINQLKSSTGSQSSSSTLDSRRSPSNPWDRRQSSLTSSNPSYLENAEIYYHDSDDEDTTQWQKVRPYRKSIDSLPNSTSTLKAPPSIHAELPTPPPTPPSENPSNKDITRPMGKLRRLMTPKPISVFDQPHPELHEGDVRAALAFVGAIAACSAGGQSMAQCPVEVTPISGLPDSWMHTAPQDTMSTLSRADTAPI